MLAIVVPAVDQAAQRELYKKALEIAKEMPKDIGEALAILQILTQAYGLSLAQCGAV